jgi:phospholipid transport system substrate-binding protein
MTEKVRSLSPFRQSVLVIAVALTVGFLAARPGHAESGATPRNPAEFMTSFSGRAIALLSDRQLNDEQREVSFRRLFTEGFDVELISRFVLGRHWRSATKAQRREYRQLFEDFIVATYARRLGGPPSRGSFVVGRTLERNEKHAVVSSEIRPPQGAPIVVEWWLRRKQDEWRIIDIMIQGISMAITQRSEFYAVISNNGGRVEGLLQRLREKTELADRGHRQLSDSSF